MADLGWHDFVRLHQHPLSINPSLATAPHPAASYLHRLARHGVPAPSDSPPWSPYRRDQAFQRGPHPSAARQFANFILEDMWDYVRMGFWTVLPFSAVRHFPHLKLAPAGVVPQRERRPRPIMDYSFNAVNQHSLPLAPTHSMQFGHTFQRLLQRLVYANPTFGPPLLMKVDLADGYYRVPLSPEAALELAVVLPPDNTGDNLIGIPLSLPMGWGLSPPYFCAFTETGADLANNLIASPHAIPPHPLECQLQTLPLPTQHVYADSVALPPSPVLPSEPLAYIDVYIDDFIGAAQHPATTRVSRALLHAVDTVFCDPPMSTRRQVVSASKLLKGDAAWSHQKRILGWDVNTSTMTLHLPPHRLTRLTDILTAFLTQQRTSRRRWHRLLGELRSMAMALHSTKYLFSILQHVLVDQHGPRIRINNLVRQSLRDWLAIANDVAAHPVPLSQLVPAAPTFIGATDASKAGMGGFWIPTYSESPPSLAPFIWRAHFPPAVQAALVSFTNPGGALSNSDLELAALVTGANMVTPRPTGEAPARLLCAVDNTPTLAWSQRGSTSSLTAPAFLLRSLAQSARQSNFTLSAVYTPGASNSLADLCSRSFHLNDRDFLHAVQQQFPIQPSWTLAQPSSELLSHMNSSLFKQMPPWESVPHVPRPLTPPGLSGKKSVPPSTKMPTYTTPPIPSPSYVSSPDATALVSWLPAGLQSALARWKMPFVPLGRRWPHWDAMTPAFNHRVS